MYDTDFVKDKSASDETELLLRFVAHRDHACPKCGYNLRDLTRPICPECGEALALTVGRRDFRDSLLFVVLAPCIFSGISAIALSCAVAYQMYRMGGSPVPVFWVMVSFGVFSGLCGLILFAKRRAFVKLVRSVQLFWALLAWAIHIAVFVAVLANL